jgi:putative selenate reductase molybdopterin-binding subunit
VTENCGAEISPPPYMVGIAEVEIDKETGSVELIDYVAVVDCGTPINPNLARVQTEGGIAQGIGMALFEDIQYTEKGAMANNSLMQYKIPSRLDVGKIRVEFKPSYEKSHPFGAKSIGEIVIDTPCPAIANAVYNAVGLRVEEMPIKPEKIAMELLDEK